MLLLYSVHALWEYVLYLTMCGKWYRMSLLLAWKVECYEFKRAGRRNMQIKERVLCQRSYSLQDLGQSVDSWKDISWNTLGPIKFSAHLESYLGYKHLTVVISYRKLLVVRPFMYFAIVEVYKLVFFYRACSAFLEIFFDIVNRKQHVL